MTEAALTLPHGVWRDGELRRDATVRALTGVDEIALAETAGGAPAARTTALLERCVTSVAGTRVTADDVRELTAGDREALVLHVRRRTVGEELECLVACAACAAPIAVELAVGELLVAPSEHPSERYEVVIGENGTTRALRFRPPNGADQEIAGPVAASDLDRAVALVLHRCVEGLAEGSPVSADLTMVVSAAMAKVDPQAEIVLDLECPDCGEPCSTVLDAADFFFRELGLREGAIFQEVHTLASRYGWSEADVLALPERRRRRYLELVAGRPTEAGE